MAIRVFISYAHQDKTFQSALNEHLGALRHDGRIKVWWDGEISPGSEWQEQISNKLAVSEIILLLISASFLSSTYCYVNELNVAMDRHRRNEALVIPILVRPCFWKTAPFAKIQGLPADMIAVESVPENQRAEVWARIAESVYKACEAWIDEHSDRPKVVIPPRPSDHSNVIAFSSIAAVNEDSVRGLLTRCGHSWPEDVAIAWPTSSNILISNAETVLSRYDDGNMTQVGVEHFVKEAPDSLSRTKRMRAAAERNLPELVERLKGFRLDDVVLGVRNFLLLANCSAHADLAYLSTWQGIPALGLSFPSVWRSLIMKFAVQQVRVLLGDDRIHNEICKCRLFEIDGQDATQGGDYIYICLPRQYISPYMSEVRSDSILAGWIVPQIEVERIERQLKSQDYQGVVGRIYKTTWTFSVSLDSQGKEIK